MDEMKLSLDIDMIGQVDVATELEKPELSNCKPVN